METTAFNLNLWANAVPAMGGRVVIAPMNLKRHETGTREVAL